jgi:hypothetical protein
MRLEPTGEPIVEGSWPTGKPGGASLASKCDRTSRVVGAYQARFCEGLRPMQRHRAVLGTCLSAHSEVQRILIQTFDFYAAV